MTDKEYLLLDELFKSMMAEFDEIRNRIDPMVEHYKVAAAEDKPEIKNIISKDVRRLIVLLEQSGAIITANELYEETCRSQ